MSAHNQINYINLESTRRQIHRTILEDGLLDITIGIYLILTSFHLVNRSFIWNYLWLAIATVLIEIIRRWFVYPRTGYVKISFSAGELIRMFGSTIVAMAVLTAVAALIAASTGQSVQQNWREILILSLIVFTVVFFCFIAYRFNVPRWYMHGVTLGGAFLIGKAYEAHGLVIGLGIWIIIVGGYVFFNYLKRFPLGSGENYSDDK